MDHPQSQIIGESTSWGSNKKKGLQDSNSQINIQDIAIFQIQANRTKPQRYTNMLVCFVLIQENQKVSQALADESWVEAMQEELLQFKLQEVWVLCDLPEGKRVIGTKWVFRNKRDERGTIIKNKARLVAARIPDMKKVLDLMKWNKVHYLYGNITEELYVNSLQVIEVDPAHPNKSTEWTRHFMPASEPPEHVLLGEDFEDLSKRNSRMSSMGDSLSFRASIKQSNGLDWVSHGNLTASRPDLMFAVCLCQDSVTQSFFESDYAGNNQTKDQLRRNVNILQKLVSLAMQESKQWWLFFPLQDAE
ncbi:hypothetical protein Tco_0078992 [Tanacetum coccineum]